MSFGLTWNIYWNTAVEISAEADRSKEEALWIEAALKGDRSAFERLVERYQKRVFRLASRFFSRQEEVEDVAQETFLTVWQKLHTYKARAPFEHWLTRVCLNCCYARFRRRRPDETAPVELGEADVAVSSGEPTARLDAERLLARLAPEDRFVLQLLHGEGWSTAEIGANLGWSVSKVKVRAHRARRRLRALVTAPAAPPSDRAKEIG